MDVTEDPSVEQPEAWTRRSTPGNLLTRVLLAVVLLGATTLVACGDDDEALAPDEGGRVAGTAAPAGAVDAPEGIDGVIALEDLDTAHTTDPVDYDHRPPMGGPHHPRWLDCGVYDEVVADEHVVHSLEHGAVWIAHRTDAEPDDLARAVALADEHSHVLVTPYPDLRAPFVVSAWGRQLDLEDLEDPRLDEFLDAYLRGGAAPEPGAPCSGGVTP